MNHYKCAFSSALITKPFSCQNALEITRRDGPTIGCTSEEMQQKCERIYNALKTNAIPELGYQDDLTQMPHSVLMKIQMGGLLGLQHLIDGSEDTRVADIQVLMNAVVDKYQPITTLPVDKIISHISAYKIRRRK